MSNLARVAFLSPTGWGNLGDAAIVESLIHAIRRRHPGAQIVGFTQRPADTTRRHAVPAFTCSGLSLPKYKMEDVCGDALGVEPVASIHPAGNGAPPAMRLQPLNRILRTLPGIRPGVRALRLARAEIRHRRSSAARIAGFDYVVVAGGGQMDDFWGGAFGHPYTLWRWAQIARRVRARYVVLSVGTGTLSPISRLFATRALAMADYCSFRDKISRELLRDPRLRDAPVVPDLAYGLPLPPPAPLAAAQRPTIGISPMAYGDPQVWPIRDSNRYRHHIETLATITVRLVRQGHEVILFTSDGPDRSSLTQVHSAARAQLDPQQHGRIQTVACDSVEALLKTLARVEIVVAARLHGVMLGHIAGRPALAIAHERKVRTLMQDMGQERYCHDIDAFEADAGWRQLGEIMERREELANAVNRAVSDNRRRVEAQYDQVFGAVR